MDSFIVSTHIPKTAGTTFANVLSRCFNRRVIFDYDGYANPSHPSKLMVEHKEFVSEYFVALHGHFFSKKYFDLFPNAKYVSTVRHPVDRVISQYMHELNEASSDAWYHDEIVSGRMDLPTFASQHGIGDAMSIHLEGRPIINYDLIMISEQMRLSLALFNHHVRPINIVEYFGSPAVLPLENVMRSRKTKVDISEKERIAVFERTTADNELYGEAVSLLERKAKNLS